MIILLDMDGVLADFEGACLRQWQERHPERPFVPLEERRTFYANDQYSAEYGPEFGRDMASIYSECGFFAGLDPVEGSQEAVRQLERTGHDLFICTTPLASNSGCVEEKIEWMERHFGRAYVRKMIFTSDKTMVRGDVLIDDRPDISGVFRPSWQHIVFEAAYNRDVALPRLNWTNWQAVLREQVGIFL